MPLVFASWRTQRGEVVQRILRAPTRDPLPCPFIFGATVSRDERDHRPTLAHGPGEHCAGSWAALGSGVGSGGEGDPTLDGQPITRPFSLGFSDGAQRWCPEAPKAVACLERDLDELLNFLSCPEAHRRKVRTTNAIERASREVRRRTRPMSCLTNDASCERIIYAVVSHLNKSWEGHALREFPQE